MVSDGPCKNTMNPTVDATCESASRSALHMPSGRSATCKHRRRPSCQRPLRMLQTPSSQSSSRRSRLSSRMNTSSSAAMKVRRRKLKEIHHCTWWSAQARACVE